MNMHSSIHDTTVKASMVSYDYKDISFDDYSAFMEALAIRGIASDFTRSKKDSNHVWTADNLVISTTHHPLLHEGYAGIMTVSAPPDILEVFHSIIRKYTLCEKHISPEAVKLDVEYHDNLNPKLWRKDKLKPDIKKRMMKIAEGFEDFIDLSKLKVLDVVLTGSSANYNWNDKSDIDIHLVIDSKEAEKQYGEVLPKYLDSIRHQWGALHEINLEGIPVELYVQDKDEKHNSTGIYSIKDDKWLVEPTYSLPTIDSSAVKKKAADYMNKIDKVMAGNKAGPVEELFDSLKKMRQAALDKDGEFSVGNLVFKTLRNSGYIEKLVDSKHRAYDRQLAIEDEEMSALCYES